VPDTIYSLEQAQAGDILMHAPHVVQIKVEEHACQDLVHDLVTYQDEDLAAVARRHCFQKAAEPGLDIKGALAVGKADLAGLVQPQVIGLRKGCGCFRASQPLEAAIVDI
jgi:hypothetical protein